MSPLKFRKGSLKLLLCLFIFYCLICTPILHAGFLGDDVLNSLTPGTIALANISLFALCLTYIKSWIALGRIFPLGFLVQYPFFYLFTVPFLYQIVRVIFIWLSLLSAAWLLQLLIKNIKASLLFLFLIPAFWSIRNMSDPLTSYALLLPALTLFIFFSLISFIKFNQTKKALWLSLSLISYTCALMTYELGVLTLFCVLVIAWFSQPQKKQFVLSVVPHVLLTCLYIILCLILRHYAISTYDGTTVAHFHKHLFLTFIYQLTASMPLNYGIFSGHCFKKVVFLSYFQEPFSIIILITVFIIVFFSFNKLLPHLVFTKKQRLLLLNLGLTLNIVPSLLIASTIKYQKVLAWGLGYLPVYIQYIGTAFIFLSLFSLLNASKKSDLQKSNIRILFSLIFSLITCLSLIFNTAVVKKENVLWQNGRDLEISAIEQGVLSHVPPGAVLVSKDQWANPAFYQQYGKVNTRALILLDSSQLTPKFSSMQTLPDYSFAPPKENSYKILGTIQQTPQGFTILNPQVSRTNVISPLFFMKYDQMPSSKDGDVIVGQITGLEFKFVKETPQLTGMTLTDLTFFSKQGNQTHIKFVKNTQPIEITWLCFHKFDLPPPSFNLVNHVNICKIP